MEIKNTTQNKSVNNGKTSFHIREEYDNGESKDVCIDQVENGYVITIEHYLPDKNKGEDGPLKSNYECKKYISSVNPLENTKKETDKKDNAGSDNIAKAVNTFMAGMSNKLMI